MKTNCIIIHGCPSNKEKTNTNEGHWYLWLKDELIKKGIVTENPLMPTPWLPNYEKWKQAFENMKVDENTVIVTHSCGGAFVVHWLSETKTRIKKLIMIAPSKIPKEGNTRMLDLYNFDIDTSIRNRVKDIVVFTSNDEERHRQAAKIYSENLNAKLIDLPKHGHYTERQMGTKEFPELLEEILK